jgi:uncharacterized protein
MEKQTEASLFLRDKDLASIKRIIRNIYPNAVVMAYGSRVSGDAHDRSDLDLAIQSQDGNSIPITDMANLREAFQESNIPILIELRDWYRVPESFRDEINRLHYKIEL